MQATQWRSKGERIQVGEFKHFVYDSNNGKPPLLILHGYPTCVYDYHKALIHLEPHFRVVMHDHLGFGFSDKPMNYSYSLLEQTDQALMLWRQLGIQHATLLAHDYGTSIATELLARQLRLGLPGLDLAAVVLCNGSMHIEMAQLRPIQKMLLNSWLGPWVAKLSRRRTLANNLRKTYHQAELVSEEEIDALWTMMTAHNGREVLAQTTQYIRQRKTYWHRWIGALRGTSLPIKLLWAQNDPVAVIAMARTLAAEIPHNELLELADLGHFPMLEDPARWSAAVLQLLA
ncbi:alpha/beta fold hydrolase [Marinicella meishanensis]|uniref:alpha/beta fold hydrolase n=1 Tax=Marinicella meishanensis TaxID=2873263 RepID=UPI001CC117F0|nr:alpha/beta hydrolase [Marinicella sp. NBU2979]